MPNQAQYPASTGFVKINPTIANAIVTKFEPESGYRVSDVVEDETGAEAVWNFIDMQVKVDVEIAPKTGFTAPAQGTEIIFIAPTQSNAMILPGTASSQIKLLITSPIGIKTENGKIARYTFSGLTNANVP